MHKKRKDLESLEKEQEHRAYRRDKRKRQRMRVSGSSVKKLQSLIIQKGRRD